MKSGLQHSTGAANPFILCLCLVALAGCSCRDREQPDPVPPKPANMAAPKETPNTASITPRVPENPGFMTAKMRVVSLSGEPVPGVAPIATLEPNAFDTPIATGALTDARGMAEIRFPSTQKVALRAWDPELRLFPNNFLEVLPGAGVINETLEITMVRAGILFAVLKMPDGQPAAGENAGIMLFHPVYGPWWPAESTTNAQGEVVFDSIPPGQFVLRLKVASGPSVEVAETYIAPGEPTSLGTIHLQ